MRRVVVSATSASDGATLTVYSPRISGKLHSVHYVPDGTVPFANTVDMTITNEGNGESIVSRTNVAAAFSTYPRAATAAPDGTAALYAAAGTAVQDKIALGNDRIKLVLAQPGNSKSGQFIFMVDR